MAKKNGGIGLIQLRIWVIGEPLHAALNLWVPYAMELVNLLVERYMVT